LPVVLFSLIAACWPTLTASLEDHWECRALKSLAAVLPRLKPPAAMLDEIKKLKCGRYGKELPGITLRWEPCVRLRIGRVGHMGATTQDNSLRAMKARQTRKIEQLRDVLLTNGRLKVREQAKLLGLCPSTAHAVLQRNYKSSGLSAAIIKRMLACPNLPESARTIILEYRDEKIAGLYGHSGSQRRRFMAAFATEQDLASQYRYGSERAFIKDDAAAT
jgi:hypothetical protein